MSRDNKVRIKASIEFEVSISNNSPQGAAKEAIERVEAEHHLNLGDEDLVLVFPHGAAGSAFYVRQARLWFPGVQSA